jgi:transposase
MHTLGIDIGKRSMLVCLLSEDDQTLRRKIENTDAGCAALVSWIAQKVGEPVHACVESTGGWEQAVAVALNGAGHTVSIANPYRVSTFARSEGAQSKTDRADAARIARFCRSQRPSAWTPPTEAERILTDLVRRRADVEQMRVAEHNRLEAPIASAEVRRSMERIITLLGEQVAEVTERIREHIEAHDELRNRRDLIVSIPGIADTTAEVILAELGDLMRFESARQAAAYCGVVPHEWTSGTSVYRRPTVGRRGNTRLRAALYYPAMAAMRYNAVIRTFTDRLARAGKRGKQLIVAAMRKLIHLVYGVIKNNAPFDPKWNLVA